MRILSAIVLTLLLGARVDAADTKPKLGVVLVVDQMRADYMERFADHGLGRFMKEGAYYENARHEHIPTYTAVGHSAISTGRYPKDHGIVGNDIYDRKTGKTVPFVKDEELGKGPFRLNAATLGDELKKTSAKSVVVSISGKDRSAILMGGKKADVVLWYSKKTGQFKSSSFYGKLPEWVEAWNAENKISKDRRKSVRKHPHLDQLTLSLARRAVEVMDLGEDDAPDLLFVGLSATDYLGHKVGPYDPLMDTQLKSLDRELGSFLDYLDRKVGANSYTAALSSDHGVLPLPESPEGKAMGARRVSSKDIRRYLESSLQTEYGMPTSGKEWVSGWNPPHVYLNLNSLKRSKRKKLVRRAADLLTVRDEFVWAHPVNSIPSKAEYAEYFRRSLPKGRAGDIAFLVKPGVLLTNYPKGTSHGTPYDYDSRVPIALLGFGVKPARHGREATAVEIAPTLGRLLGVKFKGQILKEALVR